jgi:hypothetical protein
MKNKEARINSQVFIVKLTTTNEILCIVPKLTLFYGTFPRACQGREHVNSSLVSKLSDPLIPRISGRFNRLQAFSMDDEQGMPRWPLPIASEPFDGSFVLNDRRSLVLGETIFQWRRTSEQGASERGTRVFRAKIGAKDVIVKCSWSANTRTSRQPPTLPPTPVTSGFSTTSQGFYTRNRENSRRLLAISPSTRGMSTNRVFYARGIIDHEELLHLIVELTKGSLTRIWRSVLRHLYT